MKIGIITDVVDGNKTGVGIYTYNLIKNFSRIDKENEYYLIHYKKTSLDIYESNKEIIIPLLKPFGNLVWRVVVLPPKLKDKGFDLLHDPYGLGPLAFDIPFKKVITLHELTETHSPKSFRRLSVMLHKLLYPKTVKNVDMILTDSEFIKQDIIKHLKVQEEKIKVIYLAADEKFKPLRQDEIIKIKQKYHLDFPFVLYVGGIGAKKNISALIKAYYKLKEDCKGYKLVIVGPKVRTYEEIFETVEKLNLQKDVIFTGYVPDDDLPKLYNAASLFVYPSLYEGFGLPPLEAMSCGTPVITSNAASLPEVVGDAGITVDTYDVDRLAKAIKEVLSNDGLREDMVKKGLKRAKMFSWEKTAKETLKIYEEVYYGD